MDYDTYGSSAVELAIDLANAQLEPPDGGSDFLHAHDEWFTPGTPLTLSERDAEQDGGTGHVHAGVLGWVWGGTGHVHAAEYDAPCRCNRRAFRRAGPLPPCRPRLARRWGCPRCR